MQNNALERDIAELNYMPMAHLKELWQSYYSTPAPHFNKLKLVNKLAYRMQELEYGGLPQEVINLLMDYGNGVKKIGTELMAERAGFSRITLSKIEKGDSGASVGAYVSALFVLGMLDRLQDIADARHDLIGLILEEERLPKRIRIPKIGK